MTLQSIYQASLLFPPLHARREPLARFQLEYFESAEVLVVVHCGAHVGLDILLLLLLLLILRDAGRARKGVA